MVGEFFLFRGVLDLELFVEFFVLVYRWVGMCFTLGSNWKWGFVLVVVVVVVVVVIVVVEFGDIVGDCDFGGFWGFGDREWFFWELGFFLFGEVVFLGELF